MKSFLFCVFPVLVLFSGCYAENDIEKQKTFKLPPITDTGAIQQLFDPPSAGGLDFSFYNLFASFVNQTRSTIPKIAYHSNFTLIQLGLLGAVGAMAAGVATIVAEGKFFKEQQEEEEALHHQYGVHYKRQDNPGRINYGLPNSISNEVNFMKAPAASPNSSPYGSQQINPYVYHNGNQDLSRKKRDVSFPTGNNSTEESHRPLRKRIKKKKIASTQENYQVQPSQSYEIPYEMFNSEDNYASSDKSQYYTPENELKNKTKSAKVLTSGKYNFAKGSSSTEKNPGYYVNLEQQSSGNPISANNEYDTNYYQQFISSSQQASNTQSDPNQKNSATDTLSSYVNLVDSQTNYGLTQNQNPSVEYTQQNNLQAQSNFPGNYYPNPGAPTDSSNTNQVGQTYTNQLYYRNQSQNSVNPNDPNNYAQNNLPSQIVANNQPTATPNPSSSQSQSSQNQYLTNYKDQNIQQQYQQPQQQTQQYAVQDSQQYIVQQPQQQYTSQDSQQQYIVQQPQQQYTNQDSQQYIVQQQPQQQYTIQDSQQQYPVQQPQQYPGQQSQKYPGQQPQKYPGQQSQQQIHERGQSQQSQQSQQPPTQQQQPQQQYPAQQSQQLDEIQQMQPPLPPNSQSFPWVGNYGPQSPPRRYFQESNTPSAQVRFPQQQPPQHAYKKNTNRNGQVSGQTSYYMNRPYANVNSNKRNSYKNFVLPNAPETTTQSLLSRIFNPFGLSLPPRNKKSNLITRSFQRPNSSRVKRVK